MPRSHEQRLVDLELKAAPPFNLKAYVEGLTFDELLIAERDALRMILAKGSDDAPERDAALATIRETEERIRRAARAQREPSYESHRSYVSSSWARRCAHEQWGEIPYVHSVLGDEYDSWACPNVMQRRQALRNRPDIRALLEEA
jgi:hypothetical protein